MNTMNIPGFTADASLYSINGYYRRDRFSNSYAGAVVPAIPYCGNCDKILDTCFKRGWPSVVLRYAMIAFLASVLMFLQGRVKILYDAAGAF